MKNKVFDQVTREDFERIFKGYREIWRLPLPPELQVAKEHLAQGGPINDEFILPVRRTLLQLMVTRSKPFDDAMFDHSCIYANKELAKFNEGN